mmetsp:Transcript_44247/g.99756  ORF Transcript_44247/g.99756 Transcript_44247/m.99756 type:complete len:201 (-) Transcript_44247:111-713(-)|eukprot:CAMPEP_0197887862 /NCGR_PEP_ID=MMETSP1439-20131203/19751_1 /TAXON_ID=66791 /ORGANISM="Gonyaulax spinifera, Strain CCMP409" /LENGTH=200 /DNA_ID=CAMNT_0043507721 /DNA_START=110 /DNA_END=712 /DNA_ORIENTATION=+
MPDLAAEAAGGKVFMVSSLDPEHPGDNVIDGIDGTYWISTGLYPQEVLLELGQPAKVSSVKLSSTRVRSIRFEGCREETPVNFTILAEGEVEDAQQGHLQVRELLCGNQDGPTEFLRLLILSGWDDFCSVHRIQVDGVAANLTVKRRISRQPTGLKKDGHLEVSIPEHAQKENNEPDAPRKPDHTSPWSTPNGSAGKPTC